MTNACCRAQKTLLGFLYSLRADEEIEEICRGVSIGLDTTADAIRRRQFASKQ